MDASEKDCQLCGSTGPHSTVEVREMMFGSRELFEYFECAACGTLQIVNILDGETLGRHYPADYYSYDASSQSRLVRWLTAQQDNFEMQVGRRQVGRLVTAVLPQLIIRTVIGDIVKMLRQLDVQRSSRILDVGCGGGVLLDRLARLGFENLSGADPFLSADRRTALGVPLFKRDLADIGGAFDLIMFNHSLEHVVDPVATLNAAQAKLSPRGICLVRVPTTSSEVWKMYGPDWIDIDAPRHIVIPSRKGMALAAERVGLQVDMTFDDSTYVQFIGSEAYRQDIPLTDPQIFWKMLRRVGPRTLWQWSKRTEQLNEQGRGAWAGFVLSRRE